MDGLNVKEVKINNDLDTYNKVQIVKVYAPNNQDKIINIISKLVIIICLVLAIDIIYSCLTSIYRDNINVIIEMERGE